MSSSTSEFVLHLAHECLDERLVAPPSSLTHGDVASGLGNAG
jgi:hypothetical protein